MAEEVERDSVTGSYYEPWGAIYNAHEEDDFEGEMIPAIQALIAARVQAARAEDAARLVEVERLADDYERLGNGPGMWITGATYRGIAARIRAAALGVTAPTACPVCGANGVTACEGLDGADHPGRPAFFDEKASAALDLMARRDVTAPTASEAGVGIVCSAQYGSNPELCYHEAGHPGPHSNRYGTTWPAPAEASEVEGSDG